MPGRCPPRNAMRYPKPGLTPKNTWFPPAQIVTTCLCLGPLYTCLLRPCLPAGANEPTQATNVQKRSWHPIFTGKRVVPVPQQAREEARNLRKRFRLEMAWPPSRPHMPCSNLSNGPRTTTKQLGRQKNLPPGSWRNWQTARRRHRSHFSRYPRT